MRQVNRLDVDRIKKKASSIYEAVVIAAKRARQLNEDRIAKLELMPEDDSIEIDTRKVTKVALDELVQDLIDVQRRN